MRSNPFRITLIHPCVGRHIGMTSYIRTWQMEPLPAAALAALAPPDIDLRFYDDRLEDIPFDEPTDLVCISVETYTARRAYQIASAYRTRKVPVVMGGYHATLCPDEVSQYCESLVVGAAEGVFAEIIEDYRTGRPKHRYHGAAKMPSKAAPRRDIYEGKKYLPIHLIEFARGCRFKCDFCAVQSFHQSQHQPRDLDSVLQEVHQVRKSGRMIFFIDDNMTNDLSAAKAFMRELIPMKIKWVSQTAMPVAFDDEALSLMRRSGCQGVLIGLESLNPAALKQMNKSFNTMKGGARQALQNLRRHRLRVYGTFVFGYDHDTAASVSETVAFAREQGLFIAAFNHITPFPGTPLYRRLETAGRLVYDAWWLDPRYRYNEIPFYPINMTREELAELCVKARRDFYRWSSIVDRARHKVNFRHLPMLFNYLMINYMHQRDVSGRNGLPMGDAADTAPLIKVGRDVSAVAQH